VRQSVDRSNNDKLEEYRVWKAGSRICVAFSGIGVGFIFAVYSTNPRTVLSIVSAVFIAISLPLLLSLWFSIQLLWEEEDFPIETDYQQKANRSAWFMMIFGFALSLLGMSIFFWSLHWLVGIFFVLSVVVAFFLAALTTARMGISGRFFDEIVGKK